MSQIYSTVKFRLLKNEDFLLKRNHDEDFLVVWKRIAQSMMFFKTDMLNCISRNQKKKKY